MADLIPEGCISLRSAYDQFSAALWGSDPPHTTSRHNQAYARAHATIAGRCKQRQADLQNRLLQEFVTAFSNGNLQALVRPPGSSENYVLPPDSWASAFFPERLFLTDEIVHGLDVYWDTAAGRSAFVRSEDFQRWLTQWIKQRSSTETALGTALKEHLLSLAAYGLAPSHEVEKFAAEWGLPAFARVPPPDKYRVSDLPRWTLCMAVAWIVWRTHEDVRQVWNDYRSECWMWTSCSRSEEIDSIWYQIDGEEPTTLRPTSLFCLGMAEATDCDDRESSKKVSVKTGRQELWQKLAEAQLTAAALNAHGEIVDIPAREWAYLELAAGRTGPDYLVFTHDRLGKAYSEITVSGPAVRKCWPGPADPLCVGRSKIAAHHQPATTRGKLAATRLAISMIYPGGVPVGLNVERRLEQINSWLRKNGHSVVSTATVYRALRN